MANTSLIKNILYKTLAEGVYRDVVTRSSSFYYFLGKTLKWDTLEQEKAPPTPVDSYDYEREVRNEIITIKEIKPSDVAFVIKRRNWVSNVVYDMYDDKYCDEVIGINIVSGGSGYINVDDIALTISGGGGTGATAVVTETYRGGISKVVLTNPGSGYTSEPTITISNVNVQEGQTAPGSGAVLKASMGFSSSGAAKIEDATFYVVTDEYNVYKCLDNNNGARSIYKPTGTQLAPIKTLDGYIWKFMYNIPINLRNKFYTDDFIPVVSALTNHFYSNGTIDNIFIANKGKNYTSAIISVTGDGYRESDPIYIDGAKVESEGTGFTLTNPQVVFSSPFGTANPYAENNSVNIGQIIYNTTTYDYYEVVTPGVLSDVPPSHRFGVIQNGTAALKYKGTRIKGYVTTRNDKNIVRIDYTPGDNYTEAPIIEITDPTGTGATAEAKIPTLSLKANEDGTQILAGGSGYITPVAEIVGGGGEGAQIILDHTDGEITQATITEVGSGYTSVPTIVVTDSTPGGGTGANIRAVLQGVPIESITLTNGGSNYTNPSVTITGGNGAGATAEAIVETGVIDSIKLLGGVREVTVVKSGSGYIDPPEVVIGTAVDRIEVLAGGSGYTMPPVVTLTGGGGSGAEGIAVISGSITSVTITNGGDGYVTAPNVTITGGGGEGATATATILNGAVDTITIVTEGSGYTSNPTVEIDPPSVGTGATAVAVRVGSVTEIIVPQESRGSGYTSAPTVSIVGDGTGAQAQSVLSSGAYAVVKSKLYADKVISTYVVNSGDNYVEVPSVTFGKPFEPDLEVYTNQQFSYGNNLYTVVNAGVFGTKAPLHPSGTEVSSDQWVATTDVTVGETLYYEDRLYKIMQSGTTGVTAPVHTSGIVSNGTTELEYVGAPASLRRDGEVATGIAVLRYGAGYSTTPEVTFEDPTGSGAEISFSSSVSSAKISAITENGQIAYLIIDDAGVGYTKADITVSGGGGTGAQLVPDLSLGSISSQQANNEILTPAGTIDAIKVISGGYSYGVANVFIEGDGTGAQAEAVIDPVTNAITKVNITSRGEGYTFAKVTIIGNGKGASLRAIISPYGGHGKNSPDELYARSLMFYTNVSTDLNQGVAVGNDYRQVGIIKNPRVFDGFEKYQGSIGSAAFLIQSPILMDTEDPEYTATPWFSKMTLNEGEYILYQDRVYRVTVTGISGTTPPENGKDDKVDDEGYEQLGSGVVLYVGSTTSKTRFKKDDDLYIERINHPGREWTASMQLTLGEFIWVDDRIYTVVVSGIGGSTPPTHTEGSDDHGTARLTYAGTTKSKKRYRIVSVTSSGCLVQSLDNDIPGSQDVFVNAKAITYSFTAVKVTYPNFDKYSGQLLYIDNKQGFTPSGDETITLRTIIKF